MRRILEIASFKKNANDDAPPADKCGPLGPIFQQSMSVVGAFWAEDGTQCSRKCPICCFISAERAGQVRSHLI